MERQKNILMAKEHSNGKRSETRNHFPTKQAVTSIAAQRNITVYCAKDRNAS